MTPPPPFRNIKSMTNTDHEFQDLAIISIHAHRNHEFGLPFMSFSKRNCMLTINYMTSKAPTLP